MTGLFNLRPALVSSVVLAAWLLAMYVPTLAEGVTFSDGPEIAAAIVTLAVIHPTGYPLFTMIAHFFQGLVPGAAEPCYKIALFNACMATIACLFAAATVRELSRRATPVTSSWAPHAALWQSLAGVAAALFFGLCPLLWNQVRIPEVYPFHVLLVSWALYLWVRYDGRGRRSGDIVWAALPMGLGLAHHVTIVYMLPAAFVLLLWTRPLFFIEWAMALWAGIRRLVGRPSSKLEARLSPHPWHFWLACLVGGLPLLSYLYLWWANSHTTGIPWGGISDWTTLYNHMTGAQYRHYMKGFEYTGLWGRVLLLPESYYEILFVPGVLFTVLGLVRSLLRTPALAVFLLLYALFTLTHGLQYGVGDYRNYFLPAYAVMGLFFGVGVHGVLLWTSVNGSRWPRLVSLLLCAGFIAALAAMYFDFGSFNLKLASLFLPEHRIAIIASVCGLLLLLVLWAHGLLGPLRLPARLQFLRQHAIALSLVAMFAVLFLGVGTARGRVVGRRTLIGANHAVSVARELPPGAIYMTMGDGFIFSQWYQQHALLDGIDSAVVNIRKVSGGWYGKFLRSHFPAECDPLYGPLIDDPGQYEEHCSDFRKRMDLPLASSWFRVPKNDFRVGGQTARETLLARRNPFPELSERVLTGTEDKCTEREYRTKHFDKCRCWETDKRPYQYDAWCVPSYQGLGIASREVEEINAERVIQDNIDSYPIFERNVLTRWVAGVKNMRLWDGPSYQRPSAEYSLINRGRSNQVVYTRDVEGIDACALEQLEVVRTPVLSAPESKKQPRIQDRPQYQPSEWPILVAQSYLTRRPKENSDAAGVVFTRGDSVQLHTDWFERWEYDMAAAKRRGAALTHGLRVCAFGPDGKRVFVQSLVSGKGNSQVWAIPTQADFALGDYTIQMCSVGPAAPGDDFSDRPCVRAVLEVPFRLDGEAGSVKAVARRAPPKP